MSQSDEVFSCDARAAADTPFALTFTLQEAITVSSVACSAPPNTAFLTLTLLTTGEAALIVNGKSVTPTAPCVIVSSWRDSIALSTTEPDSRQPTVKSFHFQPRLLNKNFIAENSGIWDAIWDAIAAMDITNAHDLHLLRPFFAWQQTNSSGIINPPPQVFLRISECFDTAAREYAKKNDAYGLFRIRRALIQLLFLLEDCGNSDAGSGIDATSDAAMVAIVLAYIHNHYAEAITLDDLCKLVYVNRTTLSRKFKTQTNRSPIDYLLHYRLSAACELLTHSILSIGKIAETTGFAYESYFTRQFTAKIGLTPTQYRQSDGFETLNMDAARIVDEF